MESRERPKEIERRRATVLFTDITGFTGLVERLDTERAYAIVSGFLKLLDGIARRHGGSVDKYLGDCIMATFGVPFAVEDAPRAAINAAIEMHNSVARFNGEHRLEQALDVHTGIDTGLVISGDVSGPVVREFSVMGDAVNVAARLKDLAPKGSIWVGAETWSSTRSDFEFRRHGLVPLKGKQQRVAVYEVVSREEVLHRERRARSALVGRRQPLERLRASVERLSEGTGAVVTVVGEAGLGKSRLVAELASLDEAQRVTWLTGRSISIGSNLSFRPFGDLLRGWAGISEGDDDARSTQLFERSIEELFGTEERDVVDLLAKLMDLRLRAEDERRIDGIGGEAMERLIFRAVARFLEQLAGRAPAVLVFEDVHWADTTSLELLCSLFRLAVRNPICFLVVLRPEPAEVPERIAEAANDAGVLFETVSLEPLDRGASEELLDNLFRGGDLPRAARTLIEDRTGGNPFYIEEVVDSLIDAGLIEVRDGALWAPEVIQGVSIPGTVRDVIMARIDQLPLRTREVLQIAAVVGAICDQRILTGTIQSPVLSADLEALTERGFLLLRQRADETVFEFRHPLIQEVAYETMALERRSQWHTRVAEVIEEVLGENHPGVYGMLAYHFGLGRDLDRARRYLLLAGDRAASLAASSEALHLLQEASRLYFEIYGEEGDRVEMAFLERKIGQAFFNRGKMIEGNQHFDRALELLGETVPGTTGQRRIRFGRSLVSVIADLYLGRTLERRREATERDREVIGITWTRAQAQVTADPQAFLFDSIDGLRRLNGVNPGTVPHAGGQFAGAVGFFAYSGLSFGIGQRLLARAKALVDRDDPRELLLYRLMNFIHHFLAGDWGDELTVERSLIDENLRLGELWDVINYLSMDAKRRIHQGRFAKAAVELDEIEKIAELYDYELARSNSLAVRTFLLLEQRDLETALDVATRYHDAFAEDLLNLLALGSKAKIQILLGDLEGAEATVARAERIVERSGFLPPFHMSGVLLARFWLELERYEQARSGGDTETARRLRRRIPRAARRAASKVERVAWQQPEAWQMCGRWAWVAGRRRRALWWWERSVSAAERISMRPELARTYVEIGRRLAGTPGVTFRDLDAKGCFERAADTFEDLGLARDLDHLKDVRARTQRE